MQYQWHMDIDEEGVKFFWAPAEKFLGHRRCAMSLLKASQIREQLSSIQGEVQRKKRVLDTLWELDHCGSCGGELKFEHRVDAAKQAVVERACCSRCQGEIEARRYKIC
jgi:hypothetical protein